VLAANENNVLDEFFRTGLYRPRSSEQTLATSSPSMDISKASNLERFLYDLLGRDSGRMNAAWAELDSNGVLDLTAELPRLAGEFGFGSGTSTHADRLATIKAVYKATGDIIDPHTADGVKVARDYVEDGVPMLVMETAKPAKFQETITEAIGVEIELNDELRAMLDAPQRVVEMPADEQILRSYVSEHAAL
jgi:threonine synthase